MESSSTFKRISSTKRDIEKIPAPLRSHILSPRNWVFPSADDYRRAYDGHWEIRCCIRDHVFCQTLAEVVRILPVWFTLADQFLNNHFGLIAILTILKRREIIPPEQFLDVLDELNKERPAEEESDGSDLDAEETEYSDNETYSENDWEDNLVQEDGDTNSNTNVCIIHTFSLVK
ncbi:hypothetical protein AVEN_140219-1 [Araneus ventricosus]|uniref:Uncharacterized protein n=1 Tax=Araneus ventricosus TaxID=182803 RepID=A0A4Y2I7I3_ARAVE|nr:hypothetical protein AVEN_140219-1 [Araneus ventricosus]